VTLAGLGGIALLFDQRLEDLHSRARSANHRACPGRRRRIVGR
jgi:hypothetical protein